MRFTDIEFRYNADIILIAILSTQHTSKRSKSNQKSNCFWLVLLLLSASSIPSSVCMCIKFASLSLSRFVGSFVLFQINIYLLIYIYFCSLYKYTREGAHKHTLRERQCEKRKSNRRNKHTNVNEILTIERQQEKSCKKGDHKHTQTVEIHMSWFIEHDKFTF